MNLWKAVDKCLWLANDATEIKLLPVALLSMWWGQYFSRKIHFFYRALTAKDRFSWGNCIS